MAKRVLSADIGGTKSIFAIFDGDGTHLELQRETKFATAEVPSLEAMIEEFLGDDVSSIQAATFGVAGPVRGDLIKMVNIPWDIDYNRLDNHFPHIRIGLINDLVAMAYGISTLAEDQLDVISPGKPDPQGNGALIAAGTGLGEALLIWNGSQWIPSPSEGGHTSYSPVTELEIKLLRHMNGRFGHTSFERLVSGPGLHHIYRFLRDTGRAEEPDWLEDKISESEDPSAVISELAMSSRSSLCDQALDLFAHIYGVAAGNLALTSLATGGVYLGGGIAPKILSRLKEGPFLEGFCHKGRLSGLLTDIPVKVILEPKTPLLGAARHAVLHSPD